MHILINILGIVYLLKNMVKLIFPCINYERHLDITDPSCLIPILRVKEKTQVGYLCLWRWEKHAACSSEIAQPQEEPLKLWSVQEIKVLAEKRMFFSDQRPPD